MLIQSKYIEKWMEYIRNHPENFTRMTECFWPSQMDSKEWILKQLKNEELFSDSVTNIVIFGGWYGILSQFIASYWPGIKITSVDLDPSCAEVYKEIHCGDNIKLITDSITSYKYDMFPSIVVNTICEHVTQEDYSLWWDNLPVGTKYIIQGNNYFECDEHIRSSESLQHFLEQNYAFDCLYSGTLDCGNFNRYMAIGVKT